jgi:serine/threonine protein kinase
MVAFRGTSGAWRADPAGGGLLSDDIPRRMGGYGPGSKLAGYRLETQVGQGGMAVVFRARDERLGRLVALKILSPALAEDPAFRQRFIAESVAAAAVDDPNIIPIYEANEADGVLYIAMRYVQGGDLRQMLQRQGVLSPGQAAGFISPVASALDAAHGAGLVHRDIKPGNILVDTRPGRPDHVYLSDFGVSKRARGANLTGTGQFLGTPDYSAPEQIGGEKVDGRADQYALTCLTYELLAGTPPYQRDTIMAVLMAHMRSPAPSLAAVRPDLPPEVDQVIAKGMAKAPADRYATCGDFADALRDSLGLLPFLPVTPPSALPVIRPGTEPVTPPPGAATPSRAVTPPPPGASTPPGTATPGPVTPPRTAAADLPAAGSPEAATAGGQAVSGPRAPGGPGRTEVASAGIAARTAAPEAERHREVTEAAAFAAPAAPAASAAGLPVVAPAPSAPEAGTSAPGRATEALAPGGYRQPEPQPDTLLAGPGQAAGGTGVRPAPGSTKPLGAGPASAPPGVATEGGGAHPGLRPPDQTRSYQPQPYQSAPDQRAPDARAPDAQPPDRRPPGAPPAAGAGGRSPGARGRRARLWQVVAVGVVVVVAGVVPYLLLRNNDNPSAASTSASPGASSAAAGASSPAASGPGSPQGKVSPTGSANGALYSPAGSNLQASYPHALISSLAFGPGGSRLAVADPGPKSGAGACLMPVPAGNCETFPMNAFAVALNRSGTLLATSGELTFDTASTVVDDGVTRLWDVASKSQVQKFTNPGGRGALSVAFSPDGKTLAVADRNGQVYLWDVASGAPVATLADPGGKGVNAVAFSPDGKTLAAADANGIAFLWDVGSRQLKAPLPDPDSKGANSVAFSPADGKTLAVGDLNGRTYLWDTSTQKVTRTLVAPDNGASLSVAFSPDGRTLAVGDHGGSSQLWDVTATKLIGTIPDPAGVSVGSVAFSPDGKTLATGDAAGRVDLWHVTTHS